MDQLRLYFSRVQQVHTQQNCNYIGSAHCWSIIQNPFSPPTSVSNLDFYYGGRRLSRGASPPSLRPLSPPERNSPSSMSSVILGPGATTPVRHIGGDPSHMLRLRPPEPLTLGLGFKGPGSHSAVNRSNKPKIAKTITSSAKTRDQRPVPQATRADPLKTQTVPGNYFHKSYETSGVLVLH